MPPARITLAQVENSPDVDTDKPVSRQHEMGYSGYYGYPNYWGGRGLWGAGIYPDILQAGLAPNIANSRALRSNGKAVESPAVERPTDTHLRSANNVMRYYVHASDGDIGHVQGLLVEDKTWTIRYFIVNTSNWWLGHAVLVSPEWLEMLAVAVIASPLDLAMECIGPCTPFIRSRIIPRTCSSPSCRKFVRFRSGTVSADDREAWVCPNEQTVEVRCAQSLCSNQLIPVMEWTMLRSVTELEKYTIGAADGTIGSVKDCYFDDEAWVIRYLVVATGAWLVGREVLISPFSVGDPDDKARVLPVSITKDQVRNSPSIDSQKPVSRQHEMSYSAYYGYPYYWGGAGLWGAVAYPRAMTTGGSGLGASDIAHTRAQERTAHAVYARETQRQTNEDQHLRSCEAVKGYHIHATDGDIGHVDGFLVDEQTWAIQYLIVNTSNWWLGHQVLIAPAWFEDVSWVYSKVTTSLTRQDVKNAPAYDSHLALNRSDEEGIYRHYQRQGYWHDKNGREAD